MCTLVHRNVCTFVPHTYSSTGLIVESCVLHECYMLHTFEMLHVSLHLVILNMITMLHVTRHTVTICTMVEG